MIRSRFAPRRQEGFALIVALLALVLLTLLGMSLAFTTTTELQIATNYRWSQQAYYNAEAGVEIAKRYLREVDWPNVVLPPARTPPQMSTHPTPPMGLRNGPFNDPNRSFENENCDTTGRQGWGIVLDDPRLPFPYQNMSEFKQNWGPLRGSFTAWVRRPLTADDTGAYQDNPDDSLLVLTVEGTAPLPWQTGAGAFGRANRAIRVVEVLLQRDQPGDCENRAGQVGSGPSGAGFDNCDTVNPALILGGVAELAASAQ
jgi:hypothetical protein